MMSTHAKTPVLFWLKACLVWCLLISVPAARCDEKIITLDVPVLVAGYGSAFFEETARQFEQLRPDVRIHLYGDPRISDQVRIRVMAGDYPDATDAVLLYPNLIKTGKILDLSPFLDGPNWEGDARWRDTFLPGVLDRWGDDQHVYGLPFAHAVWTLFYNKSQFQAHGWNPPKTWDDFFALCKTMEAEGVTPLSLPGVYMRYGDAIWRAAYFNLAGPKGWRDYNELKPGARSDPRFIRAADVLQKISTRHLLKGWEGMTHTAAQLAFIDGHCAMTLSASWFANEMKGRLPEGFELGAMNLPVFSDGITDPDTLQAQSGYYFVFTSNDPAKEKAAVDFFRYLTSRERAKTFARTIDSPVALRVVGPEDYSPLMQDTARILAASPASFDAAPPSASAVQAAMNQALADARQQLMTGAITPVEFGKRLESAAAAERARMSDPDRLEIRHPWAATGLLLTLAGMLAWLLRPGRWKGKISAGQASLVRLPGKMSAVFVGPAFFLFAGLVLLPGALSFLWAFSRWDGFGDRTWAGLFHFKWLLLESDVFWYALKNNFFLMVVPPLGIVPLALFLAARLHRGVRFSGLFRAVILFPNLLGGVAAALLWLAAYAPHGGLINALFSQTGALIELSGWFTQFSHWMQEFRGFAWLSQDRLYWSLIPIYLWLATGFNMVLYLAAMQGVPEELYEAARLDGASPWSQFWHVTLPLIREVLVISVVFMVITGLNAFEMIWLLTAQDPSSGSHTLSTLMVSTLFQEFQVGRATAVAVLLFVLVAILSTFAMKTLRREAVEL